MNIYLDIDGTLIHNDGHKVGQPAVGLAEFLKALRPHDTYWLTTYCKNGDSQYAQTIMKSVLPEELHADIDRIKPTKWSMQKTEAIDFTKKFIWFDDAVMSGEHKVLCKKAQKNKQRLIEIHLDKNPNQLIDIVSEDTLK